MSRRILACQPRSLHALTIIDVPPSGCAEFQRWKKSMHNAIGYRRRQCRWWRGVGIWGWWNGSGLRGVVELGSITMSEFRLALRRLGEVRLRPIKIEQVRPEVYEAAMSISAMPENGPVGRYQSLKVAIYPLAVMGRSKPVTSGMLVEPLPVMF